ncbi:MAG: prolyl oligopeptidase family serine peptidase, partial [Actinobacteria bacterium]|nr:prolyl oligopeptidase family serine peptidase [Actinomycetota bacterium]
EVESGVVRETTIESGALGEARRLWVRKPVRPGPAGLLVLLDGEDWVGRLGAPAILDNLEAEGRIAPLVAVMVDSLDRERRWRDLACAPDFIEFLSAELVPWVGARRDLDRRRTTIAGQSLGGLTALCAATRAPDVWGGAIAQSSSLWLAPEGDGDGVGWDFREIAERPPTGTRLRIEVGLQEWILLADHRRLRDLLAEAGVTVDYVEYEGGHDAICWRGGLAEALLDLSPADAG